MSKLKTSYRAFWEAGHRVFGLHPVRRDGSCGCGHKDCKAGGKHPLTANWTYTPEWSEDQLEVQEELGNFATGYGVLVHKLLVIDVDARNGGIESYARLVEDFSDIMAAGLIVETGSGGGSKHLYFSIPEGLALITHLPQYQGIDFKSSGFVVGPESLHASGNRYKVLHGGPEDIEPASTALLDALRKPERHRADIGGSTVDVSHADLEDMLSYINPDVEHEIWVRCGMAIHHATGGTGFPVWDGWSGKGTKYPGADNLFKRWHSFGKSANPVTLGTLIYYAQQAGWEQPVTFEPNEELREDDEEKETEGQNHNYTFEGVQLIRGNEISPEPISWMWKGYIARGKLQIIAGSAGTGKTSIAVNFAATVSTGGAWPDGTVADVGNVVIWSGEDGVADTLLPRLIAAGANTERVFFVDVIKDKRTTRPFDPATDMPALEKTIKRVGGASLIIVDPIVSAVGGDSHKNAETRKGLQPVVDLAASINAAVVGITHLSKGTKGQSTLERVTGSLAFGAVARLVFITIRKAVPDEQAEDQGSFSLLNKESSISAFIRSKSNIGPRGGGYEYELLPHVLAKHHDIEVSIVSWRKKLIGDPEWLVFEYERTTVATEKEIDKAKKFLRRLLKIEPKWVKDVEKFGSEANISFSSLKRAKLEIGVVSSKQSDGRWYWRFPEMANAEAPHEPSEDNNE